MIWSRHHVLYGLLTSLTYLTVYTSYHIWCCMIQHLWLENSGSFESNFAIFFSQLLENLLLGKIWQHFYLFQRCYNKKTCAYFCQMVQFLRWCFLRCFWSFLVNRIYFAVLWVKRSTMATPEPYKDSYLDDVRPPKGFFDGFRTGNFPPLYPSIKTSQSSDILEAGFIFAAVIVAFCLLLIVPGVRRWHVST